MKPIGIGKIEKARPKKMTQHSFHDNAIETDGQRMPLEHVITPKGDDDQEGQLSVDVYQTDTELILVAPVAGTAPDQISISITDDVITIKGRREIPLKETLTKENEYLQECFWGNFSRSIVLPAAVNTSQVDARFKHNVLTIRIPKTERVRTRIIRIQET